MTSATRDLQASSRAISDFLMRLCSSSSLEERLDLPDADGPTTAIVESLNSFLDKLWLASFQLGAKQEMLEKVIEIRTREVHEILDNVSTGFLLTLRDETILDNFSRSCVDIFGSAELAGKRLSALMGFGPTRQAHFSLCYEQIFDEGLPPEVAAAQLPQEFTSAGRTYAVRASPIVGNDGKVAKVFFSINDTTELHKLEAENDLRKALIEIIRQRESFVQLLRDTSRAFLAVRHAPSQVRLRNVLHTVKGNLGCYGLTEIAALVHSIEELPEVGLEHIDRVEEMLRQFLATYRPVLGFDYGEASGGAAVGDLERLRPELERIVDTTGARERRAALEKLLAKAHWVPARALMAPLRGVFDRTAERLQKSAAFQFVGQDVMVDPQRTSAVFSGLGHLVRNSLDHGIEFSLERGKKPRRGRVVCVCRDLQDAWGIEVSDDGRGIDVQAVMDAAVAKGRLRRSEVDALSPDERLRLVFLDGLTTKESATMDSGRGVGMTALLESVTEVGGSISLWSEPGQGTRVTLRIPK